MSQATGGPPEDVSPRDAAERWMTKRRLDLSEYTQTTYWYRLKTFVEWCEDNGVERMQDLSAWKIDEFDTMRRSDVETKVSLAKPYRTINNWLEWAESIGLIEEGLSDVLEPPEVKKKDEVNEVRLHPDIAVANIKAFRQDDVETGLRASKYHVLLELMWFTGARVSAIAGLDRDDVDLVRGRIRFDHRPDTGTRLKNEEDGDRIVGIPDGVVKVLNDYSRHRRHSNALDDQQREPFLTTQQGRPHPNTLRRFSYYATIPCHGGPCPHDRDPAECEWNHTRNARGCPSSRSPHRVRTGALTHMLNKDIPIDRVSERVNTSPEVLKRHYDFADEDEEFEERRAQYVDNLAIDEDDEDEPNADTDEDGDADGADPDTDDEGDGDGGGEEEHETPDDEDDNEEEDQ